MENKGHNFIKGAAILSAAGLIAKIMGFGYRVILSRVIGDTGLGLYQMAYPIYTILLVVSRSGIPVSLAKLISDKIARDQRKSAFKIFTVGRNLSLVVGFVFSLIMALLAGPIVNLLQWDPRAYYAVLALSPAIFFVSIMATFRGFFQGLQDMVPTALSQIIEQLVRMMTMIVLVLLLIPYGLEYAAAGATFGAVTGAIAGLLTLIYIYYRRQKDIWEYIQTGSVEDIDSLKIIKQISSLAIPITFGALVLPLMNLVDAAIVPQRLQAAGYQIGQATDLFGRLSGMAMVLVNFPTIITISLAASLVPSISEAFALNNDVTIKRRTQSAIRLTLLIGLPSTLGLFVLAEPLTTVIFNNSAAAIPLRVVAWGVLFITLQQSSSAILQGLGKTGIPARNLFIGAVVNGIINFTLTANPEFGIKGAALGTVTGFAIAAILNLISVKIRTHFRIDARALIIKPAIAAGLMAIIAEQGFVFFRDLMMGINFNYAYTAGTFLAVFLAVIVYVFFLLLFRGIRYNELMMIPGIGPELARNLKKLGLVGDS